MILFSVTIIHHCSLGVQLTVIPFTKRVLSSPSLAPSHATSPRSLIRHLQLSTTTHALSASNNAMFNRNFSNPFGGSNPPPNRNPGGPPPPPAGRYGADPYASPAPGGYAAPSRRRDNDYDVVMTDGSDRYSYGSPRPPMDNRSPMPSRPMPGAGRGPSSDRTWTLRPAKSPDNAYTYGNL